ncbi:MAG: cysteine synthase family protein [Pirellulales bacterium]|nr:cysteine synthase family protein [Pirellulales bacterium]
MENCRSTLSSVLGAFGNTPLVDLSRVLGNRSGRVLAKLEYLSPGHSKKDRIALAIIEAAERRGELSPGQTVVEMTSGNTGTGVAIVCAVKKYPFVAVMSEGNSMERVRMMRALGAEVHLVPQVSGGKSGCVRGEDLTRVEAVARELAQDRNAFLVDQFIRRENSTAHALGTAQEILSQTGGKFDGFCDFLGTGGTFAGCARTFKKEDPAIRTYAIEPAGAAVVAGEAVSSNQHPIQGGGYARPLPLIESEWVDAFVTVTGEEAIEWARRLAKEEGIFGGYSAGANVAVAARLLDHDMQGKTIVTMICDSGLKYLSTDLWSESTADLS